MAKAPNPKDPNSQATSSNKPTQQLSTGPRSALQREEHQAKIAKRRLQGFTFREIAAELGLTPGVVRADMKVVERQWMEAQLTAITTAKARVMAQLDEIKKAAWAGWVRSLQDAKKDLTESGGKDGAKTKSEVKGQSGNPKFLDVLVRCTERESAIFGLDAPTAQTHLHLHEHDIRLTAEERGKRLDRIAEQVNTGPVEAIASKPELPAALKWDGKGFVVAEGEETDDSQTEE